jgi:rhodanese-related sulfurtransferase
MKLPILTFLSFFSLFAMANDVRSIKAQELLTTDTSNWLVIDVRSSEEYFQGHVPGAINIAHSSIKEHFTQLESFRDKTIVLYCKSGYRAGKAAKVLSGMGFGDLRHLKGDMQAWSNAGLPIEK